MSTVAPITLPDAVALADTADDIRDAARQLRERYAPLRVVVVDEMDMRHESMAAEGTRVRLYFATNEGHCWRVTDDGREATGLFITTRS